MIYKGHMFELFLISNERVAGLIPGDSKNFSNLTSKSKISTNYDSEWDE